MIASIQRVRSGLSYLSSSDLRLQFGLGGVSKVVRVEIDWPSGGKESFSAPSVDRIITFREGAGVAVAKP
jgi:enediyne biosynthesis protein E4